MEPPPAQSNDETAIRTRITRHMNTSHRDSLSLFLRHYCNVPAPSATPESTTLETLKQDSLILTSQGKRYHIPLQPPLSTLTFSAATRQRLIEMHNECLRGLDLSDVRITTYRPPDTLIQRINFLVVFLTMLSFSRRANFSPGSLFYETSGLSFVPSFAWFCSTIQPWLITPMLGIHVCEVVWMARTRLRRHGVERWSRLWWEWVATCFIEGLGAFQRIDGMVRDKEEEMKKREK
ncbi:hypothetical protein GJ744_010400 [Endocarpon pusillum]|uniref:DUF2470 domain-containing protein n=1 Tax=Endocarpon pusillum TaxID=364733 RepID=A0A8H7AHE0_9EURO|nr:hypothetical protein GJ744_010400 [Endocarpon pusillum]